jgi:short-subunit dehydrogenase
VLVARDAARLEQAAAVIRARFGRLVTSLAADLAHPEAPAEVVAATRARGLSLDVLVNNAGFGTTGPFAQMTAASQLEMIQVNVAALTMLTRLVLEEMLARGHGKILNVASTAAFQPGPYMAVYYATKAYVLSFSEALAVELKDSGVTVTALCPGPTVTGFQQRAGLEGARLAESALVMDARTVARRGFQGMMAGKSVVIPGTRNRLLAIAARVSPRGLSARLVARLHERDGQHTTAAPPAARPPNNTKGGE